MHQGGSRHEQPQTARRFRERLKGPTTLGKKNIQAGHRNGKARTSNAAAGCAARGVAFSNGDLPKAAKSDVRGELQYQAAGLLLAGATRPNGWLDSFLLCGVLGNAG